MGLKARSGGERFTVCMELVDVERDDAGRLVVLAGFPHPTNDWGWSRWEGDGAQLDDSRWNRPWDRRVYLEQITVEPEDLGLTSDDVEWEADHARVLVQAESGRWTKQPLPFPCRRLRRLPGLGLCGIGGYGLAVWSARGWTGLELAPAERPAGGLIDAVGDGDRIIGVNHSGAGNIGLIEPRARDLGWRPLTGHNLEGMHVAWSCEGRVLVAGNSGIFAVAGDQIERLLPGQRRGFHTLTGDRQCAYAGTTSGDIVSLPADSRPRTFGLRFSRAPSIAWFGDRIYAAAGRDARAIDREGRATNVVVPMPGRGEIRMRRLGDELYAVCSHHLAVAAIDGDRESWSLIPFR